MESKGQFTMSSFGLMCDFRPGYQNGCKTFLMFINKENVRKNNRVGVGGENRFCFRFVAFEGDGMLFSKQLEMRETIL